MKKLYIPVLIILIFQGCENNKKGLNQFSSSSDTLVIRTVKQKGDGLFLLGVGFPDFKDSTEVFPYSVIFPKNVTDIMRIQINTDFNAEKSHYVDIMKGERNEEMIFIVDGNNNNDFTDDSIRVFQKIRWYSSEDLVKCKFLISNGQKIVEDSSWLKIGNTNGRFGIGKNEHLTANFSIDKERYQVGIIDMMAALTFTYGFNPEIALLSNNNTVKDTLLKEDLLKQGEFLNLNNDYYRFEEITNNGEYITLIKVSDFNNEIGTQVGMIAPDFNCLSVAGDTVRSSTMHDRIIVIANSCGCGGDQLSTAAYYEILQEFGEKIHILRLDSKIDKGLEGLQIDMEEEYNRVIYNHYRNAYCSRMCYVIGKDNRIMNKFQVSDWESVLPRIIEL